MEALATEAENRGVTFDAHAQAFWRELSTEVAVEIMDQRYEPLSWKELSWQPQASDTP